MGGSRKTSVCVGGVGFGAVILGKLMSTRLYRRYCFKIWTKIRFHMRSESRQ